MERWCNTRFNDCTQDDSDNKMTQFKCPILCLIIALGSVEKTSEAGIAAKKFLTPYLTWLRPHRVDLIGDEASRSFPSIQPGGIEAVKQNERQMSNSGGSCSESAKKVLT